MKLITVLAVALLLTASSSMGLTLNEAVAKAVSHNPQLAAARQEWEAVRTERARVTSLPDPTLEISFGSSGMDFEGDLRSLGVSQKIPFPTKISRARSQATAKGLAAEAAYSSRRLDLVKEVKDAYMELLLLRQTLDIYERNRSDALVLEEVLRLKYEVGKASQHDLIKAGIEAQLLGNEIEVLKGDDWVKAAAKLKRLLNMDRTDHLGDLESPGIQPAEIDTALIALADLSDSPELGMRRQQLAVADQDLSLARMEWVPDLMLKFFEDERDMAMGRNKARGVMFSVNLPVWGWRNGATISNRRWLLAKARSDLEATYDDLTLDLQQAVASFSTARRSYLLFDDSIIPEAQLAYESAKVAYETGKIDVLSVISAQRALREAELSRLRLWTRLAKDMAEIERITGRKLY